MRIRSIFALAFIFLFLVSPLTVQALPASVVNVTNPAWTAELLKDGEDGFKNVSTAFVGKYEIPVVSYSRTGMTRIYQIFRATTAVAGNCGPNNGWHCTTWYDSDLVPGSVSNIATEVYGPDTFGVKWVYSANGYIRGASVERMNDNSYVTESWNNLIQLSKFGGVLVGPPSLAAVGGHYRLAVTIRDNTDMYGHWLVYMHYVGGSTNTSCIDSGSAYQCDVIQSSYGYNSIGVPSLDLAPDQTVGIAYYFNGALKYAYPHLDSAHWPSNCGPGGDTWRCITIFAGTETGEVSRMTQFVFGSTSSDRAIAFRYDDTLIDDTIYAAEYVVSGGNCGDDLNILGFPVKRWKCSDIVSLGNLTTGYNPAFSIAIDPFGYPMIAYEDTSADLAPVDLRVVYPRGRDGSTETTWAIQTVDGAPSTSVGTGAQAALSFNSAGLGLIGYLQEEEYALPDLKVAWQPFQVFQPFIIKP
ncbi:MAG TPA: hypothetical protein PKW33_18155 [Anaerolineaceae bacterium]|nr:hypothetical protein [Anaerolineaceae bacterium]HPN53524.1 hypothetical protein [Anaerolineaceae bacterium]